jgi:cysteine desulfurase
VVLHGHPTQRLPNTLNVGFAGRLAVDLVARLDGVALSTGSACHAGSHAMSPVLSAMGCDPHHGLGAIRFSLGRSTTEQDIDDAVAMLREAL